MAKVNYVREHMAFMEYAVDAELSVAERVLWYTLMHIFNRCARGSDWPEGFVEISNRRLMLYCSMEYDALAKARRSLQQRGLIDFVEGSRNTRAPAYRLHYLTVEESYPQVEAYSEACQVDDPDCIPEVIPPDPQCYPPVCPEKTDNPGDKTPDLSINYKEKPIRKTIHRPNQGVPLEEEEETNTAASAACSIPARVREEGCPGHRRPTVGVRLSPEPGYPPPPPTRRRARQQERYAHAGKKSDLSGCWYEATSSVFR